MKSNQSQLEKLKSMTISRLCIYTAAFILTACAGIPISSKPYISPTTGALSSITFKSEVNSVFAVSAVPRVSETSCYEIDGVDRSPSKLNTNTFIRTQNTVSTGSKVLIPANKDVYFSWVAKHGGGISGNTFIGVKGLKFNTLRNARGGGVFVPQQNTEYESIVYYDKAQYSIKLYQIDASGTKTEVNYTKCGEPSFTQERTPLNWGSFGDVVF